ncbi:MAG TPA: flagellar biosynthesis anti-sigma factor FlgM [Verrucomicrobiae bacterium]|nr:flagellar biosynthesis anti-sigma factor FlgM [Verrucomicrobiae bacterium]
MRIDPNQGPSGAQGAASERVVAANSAPSPRSTQDSNANQLDQANLSSSAVQYSKLRSAAANLPDVRQDRVASLQQAIQAGTYSVSNQQIAGALQRDSGSAPASAK